MSPYLRTVLVVPLCVGAGYLVLHWLVSQPGFKVPPDFVEYWAAGAINLRGGDPYDAAELLAWQRIADPTRTAAVMMWNPPWSLAAYMPLGWLSPRWAALAWLGLQLLAVRAACVMLWQVFDGPPRYRWVATVLGLTSGAVLWNIIYGQNTGFLLLGLAGFAHARKTGRPAAAGAFAALTALKPHLLAAFGVVLVLDGLLTRRGRLALATGTGLVAASLGLAVLANPAVVDEYRTALRDPKPGAVPLHDWDLPVASYQLRMTLAPDQFWVQFVPCLLACLGYAAYRLARGSRWDWTAELPAVVWVSVLATPYGGWIFDLTVLLIPVIQAAVWVVTDRRWAAGGALAAGLLAVTTVPFVQGGGLHEYGWVAPVVLALYGVAAVLHARAARGRRPDLDSYDNGGRERSEPRGRRGAWQRAVTRDTGS